MSTTKFLLTLLFLPVFLLIWIIYEKFGGKKQNQQEKTRKKKRKNS